MNERTVRALQFAAVQVVGAVAVVHFAVGSEQLGSLAANGLLGDYLGGRVLERPRAPLFLLSSLALLGGMVAAGRGYVERRTAYQLGIAAMLVYLGGWVAWHTVLDHGFALSGARPRRRPTRTAACSTRSTRTTSRRSPRRSARRRARAAPRALCSASSPSRWNWWRSRCSRSCSDTTPTRGRAVSTSA
ncbi:hypothetical protein [Halosegnis marinus]|uniref:hypothetical protein n=1 Tax=Halosegnis marinus TaxID=3034023 RepID=UPI003605D735